MIITCVYCGHAYPDGTPASQHERLYEHIRGCEKHPMSAVVKENEKLKAALAMYANEKNWKRWQPHGARTALKFPAGQDGWVIAKEALDAGST